MIYKFYTPDKWHYPCFIREMIPGSHWFHDKHWVRWTPFEKWKPVTDVNKMSKYSSDNQGLRPRKIPYNDKMQFMKQFFFVNPGDIEFFEGSDVPQYENEMHYADHELGMDEILDQMGQPMEAPIAQEPPPIAAEAPPVMSPKKKPKIKNPWTSVVVPKYGMSGWKTKKVKTGPWAAVQHEEREIDPEEDRELL